MANVAHSGLTGANLHEPKGVASATVDKVYVSNGAGSGAWQKIESDRSRDGLFDAINRIAGAQYTILDLSVRTLHHTNPNHMKGNPFCPECFDILNRIKSHDKVVNGE